VTDAILDDLTARGLIQDSTDADALRARLQAGPLTLYSGFDPTADSLHAGNLVPLLVLRRFQDAGHRPIALAGGATGMIGDPSGRSDERNLLDEDVLAANVEAIKGQLGRILDFSAGATAATLVDNRTWTAPITVLDFLRDVGKHFTVNAMLGKESVRSRLDQPSKSCSARWKRPYFASESFCVFPERSVTSMSLIRSRTRRSSNCDSFSTYCSRPPILTR